MLLAVLRRIQFCIEWISFYFYLCPEFEQFSGAFAFCPNIRISDSSKDERVRRKGQWIKIYFWHIYNI
jgi:hypothetical protein